jgi:hypothetical protein
LADPSREPSAEVISRTEYAFESKKLTQEEVRALLYKEILEYHPQAGGAMGFTGQDSGFGLRVQGLGYRN